VERECGRKRIEERKSVKEKRRVTILESRKSVILPIYSKTK
jgi:hypothetical protein